MAALEAVLDCYITFVDKFKASVNQRFGPWYFAADIAIHHRAGNTSEGVTFMGGSRRGGC